MIRLSFNCPERMAPPRNWCVFDFTLMGKIHRETWDYIREVLPTNMDWQIPGLEAFIL